MKAFIVEQYGKQQALRLVDLPIPAPRDDEVLVQVHAAGVNLLDAKIRNGEFKLLLPYRLPLVLGHDVAGVVVRVGRLVSRFKPGDAVFARVDDLRIGTFAEFVPVREASLAHKPVKLSMEEAASLPLVALTAWQALVERGALAKGQKVFIEAGSGGVGAIAVQLARHLGARVATTTGPSNVDWVGKLGADIVIDYTKDDAGAALSGYDLVLHSQDAQTLDNSLRVLRPGGNLISISGPPDPAFADTIRAPWLVKQIMRLLSLKVRRRARQLGIGYAFLFMKPSGSQLEAMTPWFESGAIRPVIDTVFSFEESNAALARVESGRAKGKVVIKIV